MVSIIMVVRNAHEYTAACLKSLILNTHEDYELIVVDNASDPPGLPEGFHAHKLIENKENLGFPKAANQGLAIAEGDYICFINNDLIMTPNWLTYLKRHLDRGFDIVGPTANSVSGPQQVILDDVYHGEDELYQAAENCHRKNENICVPFYRIVGFCMLLKREVFDTIGGFDEEFGIGNFEDDDFCMRAIEAGYKVGIARDVFLHHFGSVSFKQEQVDYTDLLKKNEKIMRRKWPDKKYKDMCDKALGGFELIEHIVHTKKPARVALLSANLGKTVDIDLHNRHTKQIGIDGVAVDAYHFTRENMILRTNALTPRMQTKIPKMLGFEIKPGYDFYIWVDANITLKKPDSIYWLLSHLMGGSDIVLFKHSDNETIQQEAEFVKQLMEGGHKHIIARYMHEPMDEQVEAYLADPDFEDNELYSSSIVVMRNTPKMQTTMRDWFYHCARYSIQDQISLPYVLKKHECKVNKIDGYIFDCDYLEYHGHEGID